MSEPVSGRGEQGVTTDFNEAVLAPAGKPLETMKPFKYESIKPTNDRAFRFLGRTKNLMAAVQVFEKGGEEQLHSHAAMDGFWFVLKGAARFYDLNDDVVAECGPMEGVIIPRDVAYWFETCGTEPLEILQVESLERSIRNRITVYRPGGDARVDLFDTDGRFVGDVKETDGAGG